MRYDVFLAHAGADTHRVTGLLAALRAEGLVVFFDKDSIELGNAWDLDIPSALLASTATLVCLSSAYEAALYERAEAHLALDHHKRTGHVVIPVWLDGPPPASSVFYGLNLMQGADLTAVGAEALARKVAARVRSFVPRAPAAPAAPPALPTAPALTTSPELATAVEPTPALSTAPTLTTSPELATAIEPTPALPTALELTTALRRLTTSSFDLIVMASEFDTSLLLPNTVSLAQRVMNLVLHASETDASYASFVAAVRRVRPGLI
jgi:hypothetical protein